MKIAIVSILSVFLVFMGVQVWNFRVRVQDAQAELDSVAKELATAQQEKAQLESDSAYLGDPANLEKELKARFNYRKPDEKLIIIVPAKSSTEPQP